MTEADIYTYIVVEATQVMIKAQESERTFVHKLESALIELANILLSDITDHS